MECMLHCWYIVCATWNVQEASSGQASNWTVLLPANRRMRWLQLYQHLLCIESTVLLPGLWIETWLPLGRSNFSKNKRPLCSASKPNKVARSAAVASDASTTDATVNRSLCHPVALTTKLPTTEASSSVSVASASTVRDATASGSSAFCGSLPSKSGQLWFWKLHEFRSII